MPTIISVTKDNLLAEDEDTCCSVPRNSNNKKHLVVLHVVMIERAFVFPALHHPYYIKVSFHPQGNPLQEAVPG